MRPLTVIAGLTIAAVTLHEVSNWWEKAWATREDVMLSPDGCFRLETYKPYWILPSIFHPQPWHDGPATWGVIWGAPRFYRLYVASTGILIGETRTFDEHLGGEVTWGGYSFRKGGTRKITVDGYLLARTEHCTDPRSRQLMDDYYTKFAERLKNSDKRKN